MVRADFCQGDHKISEPMTSTPRLIQSLDSVTKMALPTPSDVSINYIAMNILRVGVRLNLFSRIYCTNISLIVLFYSYS